MAEICVGLNQKFQEFYSKRCNGLESWFMERGYGCRLVGNQILTSALECEAVQPDKSTNILQHSLFLYVSSKMGFFPYFLDHKKKNLGKKKYNNLGK